MKKFGLIVSVLLLVTACEKQAGEGGTSSISGKVKMIDLEHRDIPGSENIDTLSQYYAADKKVYIIYGSEGVIYDDSFETSWDGSFRFEFLRKGKYTLFVYSECESDTTGLASIQLNNPTYASALANIWHPLCVNEEYPKMMEIEISDNREEVQVEDITIFNIVAAQ